MVKITDLISTNGINGLIKNMLDAAKHNKVEYDMCIELDELKCVCEMISKLHCAICDNIEYNSTSHMYSSNYFGVDIPETMVDIELIMVTYSLSDMVLYRISNSKLVSRANKITALKSVYGTKNYIQSELKRLSDNGAVSRFVASRIFEIMATYDADKDYATRICMDKEYKLEDANKDKIISEYNNVLQVAVQIIEDITEMIKHSICKCSGRFKFSGHNIKSIEDIAEGKYEFDIVRILKNRRC